MNAEEFLLREHQDPDSLFQGTDRDEFMHKAICGVMEAYAKHIIKSVSDEDVEIQSGVVYHLAKPLRNAFKTGAKWLKQKLLKNIEQ